MSMCEKCDSPMHPADAAQWLLCPKCRKATWTSNRKIPDTFKVYSPKRNEHYGRSAVSSSTLSGVPDMGDSN